MVLKLDKKEKERIRALEKEYKIKLENISYYKGVPCYHFKAQKGNKIKEIFEAITHKSQ